MFRLANFVVFVSAVVAVSSFELQDGQVVFHLFTRNNPSQSQPLLPVISSIATSSFSLARQTIVTIHDYGEVVGGNFNAFVVPAHLTADDVNVLAIDWSPGSAMYTQALGNAPQCGSIIASFLNILITQFQYNPSNIRIVGVGIGGHIAGIAARNINGNVPHIIALDPALNGWAHNPERLSPDAADVVEVLYATAGLYAYDEPLGDLNFYSNGGSAQAGCGSDVSCSHIYSYIYYAESISADASGGAKFVGTACENWQQAAQFMCTGETDVHFGGVDVKSGVSGIYFFLTNPTPPHARG